MKLSRQAGFPMGSRPPESQEPKDLQHRIERNKGARMNAVKATLFAEDGRNLLSAIDGQDLPVTIVIDKIDAYEIELGIYLDGDQTIHTIVLSPNGAWSMRTAVGV